MIASNLKRVLCFMTFVSTIFWATILFIGYRIAGFLIKINWPELSFEESFLLLPNITKICYKLSLPMILVILVSGLGTISFRSFCKDNRLGNKLLLLAISSHFLIVWIALFGYSYQWFYGTKMTMNPEFLFSEFFRTLGGFFPLSFIALGSLFFLIVKWKGEECPQPSTDKIRDSRSN